MNLLRSFALRVVSPFWQATATIITSFLACLISYKATQFFDPLTPPYHMHLIEPSLFVQWGGRPPEVEVGLHIFNFPEVNFHEGRFVFEATVWFQFDPALMPVTTVDKFSFDFGEIISKSPPNTRFISRKLYGPYEISDLLFISYDIKVRFNSELDHRAFPFDDHRLNIVLQNYAVSPREMIFIGSGAGFTLSHALNFPGWYIYDHQVRFGYQQAFLDKNDERKFIEHPKVVFSLDLERSGLKDALLIILPLFLILFISLYSLGFDPRKNHTIIFSLASGSIPAMIAYRFIIQNMSPHVSYFMISDYIFGLILLFAAINFIISMVILHVGELGNQLIITRGLFFLLFHIVFLGVWYYLMFYFISTW